MKVGGKYNWKNQPERLVYLGNNWSGNGYWHQFAKVESPTVVWCEVKDTELPMIEETRCEYCDGTGDVHRLDGEWLGECTECDSAKAREQQ